MSWADIVKKQPSEEIKYYTAFGKTYTDQSTKQKQINEPIQIYHSNVKIFDQSQINDLVNFRLNNNLSQFKFAQLLNVSNTEIKKAELGLEIGILIYQMILEYIKK